MVKEAIQYREKPQPESGGGFSVCSTRNAGLFLTNQTVDRQAGFTILNPVSHRIRTQ